MYCYTMLRGTRDEATILERRICMRALRLNNITTMPKSPEWDHLSVRYSDMHATSLNTLAKHLKCTEENLAWAMTCIQLTLLAGEQTVPQKCSSTYSSSLTYVHVAIQLIKEFALYIPTPCDEENVHEKLLVDLVACAVLELLQNQSGKRKRLKCSLFAYN